ncbi:glycine betaine ABC transporter substrate-binding protein [Candidatus Bipolaricaulota bacterium]|nr:glycine betaine ABC transporter substrate-binding protein [Candidatus Bipolaricaulota bacterium]
MFKKNKLFVVSVMVMALVIGLSSFSIVASAEKKNSITFGIVPWSESLAIGSLIEHILEVDLGVNVNSMNPDIGAAYTAIKQGDMDLFVESWLPLTHEAYWGESAADLTDFGPIYEDALLCWAVPNYVPEDVVSSVEDLGKEEVKEKMDGEVVGIDPGAGLMQHSEVMMEEYPELEDWELKDSSDYAMVAELKRRMQRDNWTVVTLWKPHFAFARFDIRCIDEPENILGAEERVHMVGRKDFMSVYPNEVSEFLSRFYLPIDKVNELTDMHDENGDAAGGMFANKYPELVDYWLHGMDALD